MHLIQVALKFQPWGKGVCRVEEKKSHSIVEHKYICQQIYLSIICIISMSSVELHQIAQRSSGLSLEPWAQAKAEANSGKLAGTTLTRKGSEKWPYLAL